jgi:dihydroorotase
MGNLKDYKVIDTPEKLDAYVKKILRISPTLKVIVPIMVTRRLIHTKGAVLEALAMGVRHFKFIPGDLGTTNGAQGLSLHDLHTKEFISALHAMETYGATLLVHMELGTDKLRNISIDPMCQEIEAIRFLQFLLEVFPGLNIVVEHVSTKSMVDFIRALPLSCKISATLTLHHMSAHLGHSDPNNNCKPCLKTVQDNKAVLDWAISGDPHCGFGSDSAAHLKWNKAKGAAGIFYEPYALQGLAEKFEEKHSMHMLPGFLTTMAKNTYGFETSDETITLVKKDCIVPETLHNIPVFRGGQKLLWSIAE